MIFNWFTKKNKKRVFLDYASSTPIREEVFEVLNNQNISFANPSALYKEARQAKDLLENARKEVGEFFNCQKEKIVFTSGGTESNNIAILGVYEKARENGIANPHIISVATEHPSVIEVLGEIKMRGGEVTLIYPKEDGIVEISQIKEAVKENTVLVSLMFVNNEIGVVQDIKGIGQMVKKIREEKSSSYPLFHTDSCQAPLFYPLDVSTLGIDLLCVDGLKIGGPRSCGVLFVRDFSFLNPVIFGGGQEKGIRSGTENVYSSMGLAKALSLAKKERREFGERVEKLRDYFLEQIKKEFPECEVNGSLQKRVPNNLNICFPGLDSEYLVIALDTYGVSVSYSSSCRTLKEDSSSYVLDAIGKGDCNLSSLRFTLGQNTIKSDLDFAINALKKAVEQVKK